MSWSDVFASLGDNAFFEVVRHYIGPVSTPFHKPELVKSLSRFFDKPEHIQRAESFLDEVDEQLLTLIIHHPQANESTLLALLSNHDPWLLRDKLLNLEERLLVWIPSGSERIYHPTPMALAMGRHGKLGPMTLLKTRTPVEIRPRPALIGDAFFNLLLAVLHEGLPLTLKEGGIRKKAMEHYAQRFPPLFRDEHGEQRIHMIAQALQSCRLGEERTEGFSPIEGTWKSWESAEASLRRSHFRGHLVANGNLTPNKAIIAANLLCQSLPANTEYTKDDLSTLFALAAGIHGKDEALVALDRLVLFGELAEGSNGHLARPEDLTGGSPISIAPTGDVTLGPDAPLSWCLSSTLSPINWDTVSCFSFQKESFLASLDRGLSREWFLHQLEELSGRPLPQNIQTLLEEWEHSYRSLDLKAGVLLQATGAQQQLLEATKVLAPYTLSQPHPELWILNPLQEREWRMALKEIGIERIPPLSGTWVPAPHISSSSLPEPLSSQMHPLSQGPWEETNPSHELSVIQDSLRTHAHSIGLTSEELEAFEDRLDRKIILSPQQIQSGLWRKEATVAKGLDYHGKLRLAEAALSHRGERLALTIAVGNDLQTILVVPRSIEKEEADHILVGRQIPSGEETRYRIRKIGLLKRIRASLF